MNSLAMKAQEYWQLAKLECHERSVWGYLEAMDALLRSAYQQDINCFTLVDEREMRFVRQRYGISPDECDEVFERGEAAERALFKHWKEEDDELKELKEIPRPVDIVIDPLVHRDSAIVIVGMQTQRGSPEESVEPLALL